MKFFIDSANLDQIKEVNSWFPLAGATTNPTLVAGSGEDHHSLIQNICLEVKGPVSAEVLATEAGGMVKEGRILSRLHKQVVVKLPLTKEGLVATRILNKENIRTNLTLCFSALQALTCAQVGATFVSIFVGRLDDIGGDGMEVVHQAIHILAQHRLDTQVLVASVRHVSHILTSAELGVPFITIPPPLFLKMVQNPLTDKGLAQFLQSARRDK